MTCYLRHIEKLLENIGSPINDENRRQIDRILHQVTGIKYRDCPMVWKKIRRSLMEDRKRKQLLHKIKKALVEKDG